MFRIKTSGQLGRSLRFCGALLAVALPLGIPVAAQGEDVGAVTYDPSGGVALEWVAEDVLAIASDGVLRVFDLSGDSAKLLPSPALPMRPILDRVGDRLAGVTRAGEIVQWRIGTWEELNRQPGFGAAKPGDLIALTPDQDVVLVGDGKSMLAALSVADLLPRPLSYPGPKGIEELGFGPDGMLHVLPTGWVWDPGAGSWRPGVQTTYHKGDGRNQLAWDPIRNRTAMFRFERSLGLTLTGAEATLAVDLGYREAMDMVLDLAGSRAVVSFPGAEGELGYGPQEFTGESSLGTLESYDAKTGELLAMLPSKGLALSPQESPEYHTMGLGMRLASLEGGGLATIDFVEDHGQPSIYLRLRGADLIAVAEVKLEGATWPVFLASGGDRIAVCYPEKRIDVFELENGYYPKPDAETGLVGPGVSIEISPLAVLPSEGEAAPRSLFALRSDGGLLAMTGPDGNVSFADPRSGWPNEVVSVRLPKDHGVPLSTRFSGPQARADGTSAEGEYVVTAQLASGVLVEWTLNADLVKWSEPVQVSARARVSHDGAIRADLRHGMAGNVESRGEDGELLWRVPLGFESAQAIAISPSGGVAVATGGKLMYVRASMVAAKPEVGDEGDQ